MTKLLSPFTQALDHQNKDNGSARALQKIWNAWIKTRIEYAKQYVVHEAHME